MYSAVHINVLESLANSRAGREGSNYIEATGEHFGQHWHVSIKITFGGHHLKIPELTLLLLLPHWSPPAVRYTSECYNTLAGQTNNISCRPLL